MRRLQALREEWRHLAGDQYAGIPPCLRTDSEEVVVRYRNALQRRLAPDFGLKAVLKPDSKAESADIVRDGQSWTVANPDGAYRALRVLLRVELLDNRLVPMNEAKAAEEYEVIRGQQANEYAERLVAYYNSLTLSSMFDPGQAVVVLKRVERLEERHTSEWWRKGGRLLTDLSFAAEQLQPGSRAVRISLLSSGQVVDEATTTSPPTADEQKVVIPLTKGYIVLELVTKAAWDALIDTLDGNTGESSSGGEVAFRLRVRRTDLHQALKLLNLCVGPPKTGLYMPIHAVYAHSTDTGVELVSTDTYRLVACQVDGTLTVNDNRISTLVPPKLLKMAANAEGKYVTVTALTGHRLLHDPDGIWAIEGETGDRTVYCYPLIRASFPNYEEVITGPTTHTALLGTAADLIRVLRPLLKESKEDGNPVSFLATDRGYVVNTQGSADVALPDSTGTPSFALNGKWLMSYLSALPKEQQVVMSCKPDRSGVVTDPRLIFRGDRAVYVQVPMQLQTSDET